MEVYVIRHTPVAVEKGICYGQTDVPLADTFVQDIQFFQNELPKDFDKVFCSPLIRCKKLAYELGFQDIIYENALMEMNFGNWENQKWNHINPVELERWMIDFVNVRTPNGENLFDLYNRVELFLNNLIKQEYQKVLLITHAGVIRCIMAYYFKIPLQNLFKMTIDFQQIFIFDFSN